MQVVGALVDPPKPRRNKMGQKKKKNRHTEGGGAGKEKKGWKKVSKTEHVETTKQKRPGQTRSGGEGPVTGNGGTTRLKKVSDVKEETDRENAEANFTSLQ